MSIHDQRIKVSDPEGHLCYTGNRDGDFFLLPRGRVSSILHCREEFALIWRGAEWIGIANDGTLMIKRLNRFVETFESMLGFSEDQRTVLNRVTVKNYQDDGEDVDIKSAVVIKVPAFWRANTTRRSLYTLLLRAGVAYYEKTEFWGALERYTLSRNCLRAIRHFLAGNTIPTYKSLVNRDDYENAYSGFVSHFESASDEDIAKWLVKSEVPESVQTALDKGT